MRAIRGQFGRGDPPHGVALVVDLEDEVGVRKLGESRAVLLLDTLGLLEGDLEQLRDIPGDVIAAKGHDGGVREAAAPEDRDVGRAAPDVHQHHGHAQLLRAENGKPRGVRLQHQALHLEPGGLDRAPQVRQGALAARDEVHVHLEAHPGHAHGVPDAFLAVHAVLEGQGVDELVVPFEGEGLGLFDRAFDVGGGDAVPAADRGEAVAGHAADVRAGYAHVDPLDGHSRHPFGGPHARADGLGGAFQVHDDAALHALGGNGAFPDDVQNAVRG